MQASDTALLINECRFCCPNCAVIKYGGENFDVHSLRPGGLLCWVRLAAELHLTTLQHGVEHVTSANFPAVADQALAYRASKTFVGALRKKV